MRGTARASWAPPPQRRATALVWLGIVCGPALSGCSVEDDVVGYAAAGQTESDAMVGGEPNGDGDGDPRGPDAGAEPGGPATDDIPDAGVDKGGDKPCDLRAALGRTGLPIEVALATLTCRFPLAWVTQPPEWSAEIELDILAQLLDGTDPTLVHTERGATICEGERVSAYFNELDPTELIVCPAVCELGNRWLVAYLNGVCGNVDETRDAVRRLLEIFAEGARAPDEDAGI